MASFEMQPGGTSPTFSHICGDSTDGAQFTLGSGDPNANPSTFTPTDLTGSTITLKIGSIKAHPATTVLTATTASTGTGADKLQIKSPASSGIVLFKLLPSDTANVPPGYYYYQIILSNPSTNTVLTLIEGQAHLKPRLP